MSGLEVTIEKDNATDNVVYTRREVRMIIFAVISGWAFEFYNLQILSIYGPDIMKSFQMSQAAFGTLSSIPLLFTAIGGVVFGMLADKFGRKRILAFTILLFSIATFLIIFAKNIETLFILRALTGLGIGGEWAVGFSLLNEAWIPKRRGLIGGIVQASIWPAYALAVLVNQFFTDWHWGFAIGGLPILLGIWILLYIPESKVWKNYNQLRLSGKLPPELMNKAQKSTLVQIFQKDMIRYTLLGTTIAFGAQYAYYSLSQWMPTLLVQVYNFTASSKSSVLYLGAAVAFVSHMAGGALSDIFGRRKTFMSFALFLFVSYSLFAYVNIFTQNTVMLVISYLMMNFGFGLFGIFGVWFSETFPTRARATGSSFAYNVGRGIASSGPLVVGLVATSNSLLTGVSTGAIAILIMLLAIPFMSERKGREISSLE
ncbi:MAG: MFS transporter [Desulfitobacteriia bacterium]|jgi:MFS family permease